MKTSLSNDRSSQRAMPVEFRFPVEKTGENSIVVLVPTQGDIPLFDFNPMAVEMLRLSAKEHDKMYDAAFDAAIRSIMIKE